MAGMKVVEILTLTKFNSLRKTEDLMNKIKEYLGERNVDITSCAHMIKKENNINFCIYFSKFKK